MNYKSILSLILTLTVNNIFGQSVINQSKKTEIRSSWHILHIFCSAEKY